MISQLKTITIENFRGIRALTLELHPKVNIFFGANGAGKTTILDAIAIGLGPVISLAPKAKSRSFAKDDLRRPWIDDEHYNERKNIECKYTRIAVETQSGVKWDVHKLRSKQDKAALPPLIGQKQLRATLDPLIPKALDSGDEAITDPFPLIAAYGTERSLVNIPLRERDFNKDFERVEALDQALEATTRFKTVFEWLLVMEDEERRQREARRDFDYKLPSLEWVRDAVRRSRLRCNNPHTKHKPIRLMVDFEHEDGAKQELNVSALSNAYRTHFALVADLARRMVQLNPSDDLHDPVRGTNTHAVVLIDELDLHLDYPWQARVIQDLCEVFPNTQFIVSTHSEQVVGAVRKESVRQLIWEDNAIRALPVPFAQGATGERIQVELMGAPIIPPAFKDEQETIDDKRRRYLKLVALGRGKSDGALALRAALELAIPGDSALHRADLDMQRRELMERLEGDEL